MHDPRLKQWAGLLTNYCVAVQPGDRVAIRGDIAGYPLLRATYREVLRAGGHPHLVISDLTLRELLYSEGNDAQLDYVSPFDRMIYDEFECYIGIRAETNTRTLSGIDPARQQRALKSENSVRRNLYQRAARGEARWVGTRYPTNGYAQDADMAFDDYVEFVFKVLKLNRPDPVAAWQKLSARQQRLVDWLEDKRELKLAGPNIDLTLSIAGRHFINSDGRRNMPSGEIYTGPVEDSVNGWVRYTYPAIHGGREVSGIELRFEAGKVVQASASKNDAYLQSVLNTDAGARYVGEFAIGTNDEIDRFTRSILFDEKIGGTIHMAIGQSYPETGGVNRSTVHWDMICDMRDGGQILADGKLFYDSGRFFLPD